VPRRARGWPAGAAKNPESKAERRRGRNDAAIGGALGGLGIQDVELASLRSPAAHAQNRQNTGTSPTATTPYSTSGGNPSFQ
jgi:hypothetical protein